MKLSTPLLLRRWHYQKSAHSRQVTISERNVSFSWYYMSVPPPELTTRGWRGFSKILVLRSCPEFVRELVRLRTGHTLLDLRYTRLLPRHTFRGVNLFSSLGGPNDPRLFRLVDTHVCFLGSLVHIVNLCVALVLLVRNHCRA